MRLKVLIFTILLGMLQVSFAQEKEISKLERLYRKHKFERCAEYAKDCIREYRHEVFPYAWAIKSYLAQIPLAEKPTEEYRYIRRATAVLKRWPDTTHSAYPIILNDMRNITEAMLETWEHKYPRYAPRLAKVLVEINQLYLIDETPVAVAFPLTDTSYTYVDASQEDERDSVREVLISMAESLVGSPYLYGGDSPQGFDCSGFTQYVYRQVGIQLPHNAQAQSKLAGVQKGIDQAQPGDLVFFGTWVGDSYKADHTALVLSVDESGIRVIHSVSNGVIIDDSDTVWDAHWRKKVLFVKDILAGQL